MNDTERNYLEHHGVKGMKWGVRRAVGSDGLVKGKKDTKKKSTKKKSTNDDVTAKQAIRKSVNPKNLSDKELRAYSDRLNLENRLKKLSQETNTRITSKERKAMSNAEIKKVSERLQLESNLKKQARQATRRQNLLAQHAVSALGDVILSEGKQSLMEIGLDTFINVAQDKRLYNGR